MNNVTNDLKVIDKLNRDILKALRHKGGGITNNEARFMVDLYYSMQDQRIGVNNQIKALDRDAKEANTAPEPHEGLDWIYNQSSVLEQGVAKMLAYYTKSHPMSWFFDQTVGIGPVLSAGLLAHINIHKAPTVGHIWNFAGLNPDVEWKKGHKRPWNAKLKTLCWKIGDSFVKFSYRDDAYYGQLYLQRKKYEWDRNLAGDNSDTATAILKTRSFSKTTDTYSWYSGQCSAELAKKLLDAKQPLSVALCCVGQPDGTPMLSPAHIDMRARRYAVKMFLSHLHQRWREAEGLPVPEPFAIGILKHGHRIDPPQVSPKRPDKAA